MRGWGGGVNHQSKNNTFSQILDILGKIETPNELGHNILYLSPLSANRNDSF